MLDILNGIFGRTGRKLTPEEISAGTVIDVRTRPEFEQGHLAGSINIPLQELDRSLLRLRQVKQPVITCCRSGNRSGIAAKILKAKGIEVINGGRWNSLKTA